MVYHDGAMSNSFIMMRWDNKKLTIYSGPQNIENKRRQQSNS